MRLTENRLAIECEWMANSVPFMADLTGIMIPVVRANRDWILPDVENRVPQWWVHVTCLHSGRAGVFVAETHCRTTAIRHVVASLRETGGRLFTGPLAITAELAH